MGDEKELIEILVKCRSNGLQIKCSVTKVVRRWSEKKVRPLENFLFGSFLQEVGPLGGNFF